MLNLPIKHALGFKEARTLLLIVASLSSVGFANQAGMPVDFSTSPISLANRSFVGSTRSSLAKITWPKLS